LLSLPGAKLLATNAGLTDYLPSLTKDKNGELWVVRGRLLGSLKNGRLIPWPPPGVQPDTNDVQRACLSRDGGLWLVGSGGVKRLNSQGATADWGPAPWGQDTVTALLETKSGDLLVGTLEEGLFLLSPDGTSLHFTRQNGLSKDWVLALC